MTSEGIKILAIDDNADNLVTVKAIIGEVLPGSVVLTALNGQDGIDIAKQHDPDVILLDVIMPGMDGFEVCETMKKDAMLQEIPVLFLTAARTDRETRLRAIEAGAEAFLTKPIDETELMVQIKSMAKIKAGNEKKLKEKARLESLVLKRTQDIKQELHRRIKVEEELKKSEERYKSIFDQSPMGIALTDSITREMFKANPEFLQICGRTIDEMHKLDWTTITHPDDIAEDLRKMADMRDGKTKGYQMEKRFIRPNGSIVWVNMTIAPIRIESGNPCHLCMIEDITEKRAKEQRIEYLSYHDTLTGLYNRAFYEETVEKLNNAEFFPFTVMTGDINGLKLINDTLGHAEGDKVIIEVGRLLEKCVRERDYVARVGGDEFSILMPKTNTDEAQLVLDCIYNQCREHQIRTEKELEFLSISLGFATKTKEEELFDNIEKIAEDHMYKRKLLEHKSFHNSLISSMRTTLFEKSNETQEHAARLVRLSQRIGGILKLREEQLNELELLSELHDIGKISIDDRILKKAGSLSESEWLEMRKHPDIGYRIAMASPELEPIAEYILCHHERWDGKGYPQGLCEEEIPLHSRILSIIDAYDAMTENRPYRKAMPIEDALSEIVANAGTQFDPLLATVFVEMVMND